MNARWFSENYFMPAVKRLGLQGVRWHTLRHTFGSWLKKEGVPISIIQNLMRHADIRTTQRYAHIGNEERKKAVNRISELSTATKNRHQDKKTE